MDSLEKFEVYRAKSQLHKERLLIDQLSLKSNALRDAVSGIELISLVKLDGVPAVVVRCLSVALFETVVYLLFICVHLIILLTIPTS